jgi:hypothetical protein
MDLGKNVKEEKGLVEGSGNKLYALLYHGNNNNFCR